MFPLLPHGFPTFGATEALTSRLSRSRGGICMACPLVSCYQIDSDGDGLLGKDDLLPGAQMRLFPEPTPTVR